MRAVEPAQAGIVESPTASGSPTRYSAPGSPTIVFLPSTPIVHSRQWKGQVPYFSRRHRVVAYDGRGNGRSDRPTDAVAYDDDRLVGDLEAVMDATGTARAVLVGLCGDGVWRATGSPPRNPERVAGDRGVRGRRPAPVAPRRTPWRSAASVRRRTARVRGLAEGQPSTTGGATTRTSPASSSRRSRPSPIRRSRSRTPSNGRSTDRSSAMIAEAHVAMASRSTSRRRRGDLPRRALPDAPRPRDGGHLPAARAGRIACPS